MVREIDRGSQVTVVEPATGERREQLIAECKSFIEQKEFPPFEEYLYFGRFVENMTKLIGGERENDPALIVSTPFIIDKDARKAIRLTAGKGNVDPEVTVQIAPEWFTLSREKRNGKEAELIEPYLVEVVATNSIFPEIPYIQIKNIVVYPPNSQRIFMPYATLGSVVLKEEIKENKLAGRRPLFIIEQKALAVKIFNAWQSSQPQTPPNTQAQS